ncbi:MAG TPA: hypothetical protein VE967_20050 [Gemmatimonadaceae bacterium]|nr:hypothetical protein [Gemmatimonadaceae bacterium]
MSDERDDLRSLLRAALALVALGAIIVMAFVVFEAAASRRASAQTGQTQRGAKQLLDAEYAEMAGVTADKNNSFGGSRGIRHVSAYSAATRL